MMKWMFAVMIATCLGVVGTVVTKHADLSSWMNRGAESGMSYAEMEVAERLAMEQLTAEPDRPELARSLFVDYGGISDTPVVIVGDSEEAMAAWQQRLEQAESAMNSPVRSAGRMASADGTSMNSPAQVGDVIEFDSRISDRLRSEGKSIFAGSRFGHVSDTNRSRSRQQYLYHRNTSRRR